MTDWAQIFTCLLFYAYVEIHQVRRLVFDILPIVSTVFKLSYSIHIMPMDRVDYDNNKNYLHKLFQRY